MAVAGPRALEQLLLLSKPELQALALDAGIKRPGVGWPTCCPPKGSKADVAAAVFAHSQQRKTHEAKGESGSLDAALVARGAGAATAGPPKSPVAPSTTVAGVPATPQGARLSRGSLLSMQAQAGEVLDWSNRGLSVLPDGWERNDAVLHLLLSENRLVSAPDVLAASMPNLTSIALDSNAIACVPASFFSAVPHLQSLDLRNNQLRALPDAVGQVPALRELLLDGNKLAELPTTLGRLARLETLHVDRNRLVNLPNSLGDCRGLKDLFVGRNPLTSLPVALGKLSPEQLTIRLRPPCDVANVPPEKRGSTREILDHLRGLLLAAEADLRRVTEATGRMSLDVPTVQVASGADTAPDPAPDSDPSEQARSSRVSLSPIRWVSKKASKLRLSGKRRGQSEGSQSPTETQAPPKKPGLGSRVRSALPGATFWNTRSGSATSPSRSPRSSDSGGTPPSPRPRLMANTHTGPDENEPVEVMPVAPLARKHVYLVTDTNQWLHAQDESSLRRLVAEHAERVTIIVPLACLSELEKMKGYADEKGYLARTTLRYILDCLKQRPPRVRAQKYGETLLGKQHHRMTYDHQIMDCALYIQHHLDRQNDVEQYGVCLLTADIGLQVAAVNHNATVDTAKSFLRQLREEATRGVPVAAFSAPVAGDRAPSSAAPSQPVDPRIAHRARAAAVAVGAGATPPAVNHVGDLNPISAHASAGRHASMSGVPALDNTFARPVPRPFAISAANAGVLGAKSTSALSTPAGWTLVTHGGAPPQAATRGNPGTNGGRRKPLGNRTNVNASTIAQKPRRGTNRLSKTTSCTVGTNRKGASGVKVPIPVTWQPVAAPKVVSIM